MTNRSNKNPFTSIIGKPVLYLGQWVLPLFLVLSIPLTALTTESTFESQWDSQVKQMEDLFEQHVGELDQQWTQKIAEQEAEWEAQRQRIEAVWHDAIMSTNKTWVDYAADLETRSRVDFEHGVVTVETMVPVGAPDGKAKAVELIASKATELFLPRKEINEKVLENQVVNSAGQPVTTENADDFLKKEVLTSIEKTPTAKTTADGREMEVHRVNIKMVPRHLEIRAGKYLPIVLRNTKRFDVPPELVLAVIHTESYFNPMAVSRSNAIGLMQIIPRYAGREAYQYIHKKDGLISPAYLQVPEQNIELGTAYLHILSDKYFGHISDDPKNRYLTICGYNWGPGSMGKKILKHYPIDEMDHQEVYDLLEKKTPKETQDYLQRVTTRIPIYSKIFQ